MKHIIYIYALMCVAIVGTSCTSTNNEKAQQQAAAEALLLSSQQYIQQGMLEAAKPLLDSVHSQYPLCVDQRRRAQALADSITYLESALLIAQSDSILQGLLPQVDPLLKAFRYEKNAKYETNGKYTPKSMSTDANMGRCFLQANVFDDRTLAVKSFYVGSAVLQQNAIEVYADDLFVRQTGTSHNFNNDINRSILSFQGDQALEILNFISAHQSDPIKVKLIGTNNQGKTTSYAYNLSIAEKKALADAYQLGILMRQIKHFEDTMSIANQRILRYQARTAERAQKDAQ